MDDDLLLILQNIVGSADDTGCSYDENDEAANLTVVSKSHIDELSEYLKSQEQNSGVTCQRCGSHLDPDGFCQDETCPYSDWSQSVPNEMFNQDATTLDIFDECSRLGLLIAIKDESRRADNDLFKCDDCGFTFDNDESICVNGFYYCVTCVDNNEMKYILKNSKNYY